MNRILSTLLIFCLVTVVASQESVLTEQLKNLVRHQMEAFEAEDLESIERTFHPDTPVLDQTLMLARQLSETYDLEYDVGDHWIYIGQDDTYAYARIEQITRRLDGPAFQDNAVDQVWVFKQFKGEWRVWTTGVINIDFFVPPISGNTGRRSTYPSADLIFDFTETEIVDCETREEFSSLTFNSKAECGITETKWEEFSGFELSAWFDGQLAPENWKSSNEKKYIIYFDEDEAINLKLSYIQGGFITVEPVSE